MKKGSATDLSLLPERKEVIILYSDAIVAAAKGAEIKSCSKCHDLVFVCLGALDCYLIFFLLFYLGRGKVRGR